MMNDVTRILNDVGRGNLAAAEELLPILYQELRMMAAQKLAEEAPGNTLQPTALVHEAYLRLVGRDERQLWEGRRHFFGAAAEAMRRILIESARRKNAQKRGGGMKQEDLDHLDLAAPQRSEELLAVDEALSRLHAIDASAAELVKLRYFAGLSLPEAAKLMGISPRSADRLWAYAKAWLHRELTGGS